MRQLLTIFFITLFLNGLPQERKYSTFYEQRFSLFDLLPISSEDIVFVGDSIINGAEWSELFGDNRIKNRGISGDLSEGVYDRIESIIKGKPRKIFLMIGINDIAKNIPTASISKNIEKIILRIRKETPHTSIYLQSVLPVNVDFEMFADHMKPDSIKLLNAKIEVLSQQYKVTYIDLYSLLVIKNTDKLSPEYTNDGLHLLGKGYVHWRKKIIPYIKEKAMNTTIERLPDYPIVGGISASFSGICDTNLIIAGGCNFPSIPASEGGKKVFYNDIYYLNMIDDNKEWIKGGILPYQCAYGTYVSIEDEIICIGGQNNEGAIDKVIRIHFDKKTKTIITKQLPALPIGLFNAGSTTIGQTIYVAGGVSSDGKQDNIYTLNMENIEDGWKSIKTNQQDERQQPVVFAQDHKLFMAGGYNEKDGVAVSDVLQFNFLNNQWFKVADIRINGKLRTLVGAGSINLSSSHTLFMGGVDYEIFSSALQRTKKRQEAVVSGNSELVEVLQQAGKEYMTQEPEWYKFATTLLSFDIKTKEWKIVGDYPQLARAGAGIAIHGSDLYSICGELKPGIRTAEIYKLVLENLDSIK